MGTLAVLAAGATPALTLPQLAAQVGVLPLLLANVDLGRQALPVDVARRVADVLGLDLGTVLVAAGKWTPQTGPMPSKPLPPDPLLQPISAPPWARTAPGPTPVPQSSVRQLWTLGAGVGGLGSAAGAGVLTRDGKLLTLAVAPVAEPGGFPLGDALAYDGQHVLAFAEQPTSGSYYAVRISTGTPGTPPAVLASATDPGYEHVIDACWEPATASVWVTCDGAFVAQVAPDLSVAARVVLTATSPSYGTQNYTPSQLCAVGGKLYVAAAHNPVSGPPDGRLFEVDPVAATITRTSPPAALQVFGVAYDPATELFLLTSSYYPSPGLWAVPRGAFTVALLVDNAHPPAAAPPGWPGFADTRWLSPGFGSAWVSDYESTLHRVDPATGNVLAFRRFGGPSTGQYLGRSACDPPRAVYVADPYTHSLHAVDPLDLAAGSSLVYDVAGGSPPAYPGGLLLISTGFAPPAVP